MLQPLRRIWAEPTDLTHPEQSVHYGLGPVGGHPSQAAPPVSASPYVVIVTRVTRWIPRSPAEPYPGVHALLSVKVLYASSSTSPIGPLWWIPEGVVYLSKATFPLSSLLSLYFVVLSAYDGYASTIFTTSGPIEWILGGVQGIFKNHSEYDSPCDKYDGKFTLLVLIEQGQGRCMRREGNYQWPPCPCLSLCGLFLVLCWPCCHPVKSGNPLSAWRIYAVRYTGGVALAWLPIYQQIITKGMEDSRCGHRVRECVQPRSAVDRLRAGSRARGRAAYTPNVPRLHTHSFSKPAPVDRQLARRDSASACGQGSLRRATPSRRAARGHLTHVHGAT